VFDRFNLLAKIKSNESQLFQYLACLSTSSSNDKLSFDVGLQEHSQGEACWWTVHPASKQRSEGEKVRVGDDLILVSVATERYLHTTKENEQSIVNASFHVTHWSVQPYGTGISRMKYVGYVFGGDVLRFFHGMILIQKFYYFHIHFPKFLLCLAVLCRSNHQQPQTFCILTP